MSKGGQPGAYPSGFHAPVSAPTPAAVQNRIPPPPPHHPFYTGTAQAAPFVPQVAPYGYHALDRNGNGPQLHQQHKQQQQPPPPYGNSFHSTHSSSTQSHHHTTTKDSSTNNNNNNANNNHNVKDPNNKRAHNLQLPVPPTNRQKTFKCLPCKISLDSVSALRAHQASHVTCTAPQCSFAGSPTVVKGHYQSVHGKYSGVGGFKTVTVAVAGCPVQRFRICVGNRPEDVQRWIRERRQRFPRVKTKEAVAAVTTTTTIVAASKEPSSSAKTGDKSPVMSSLLDGYGSSCSDDDDNDDDSNDERKRNRAGMASGGVIDNGAKGSAAEKDSSGQSMLGADSNISKTMEPKLAASSFAQANASANTRSTITSKGPPLHPARPKPRRICRYFAKNGTCRNGDTCHFSHDTANHGPQNNQHSAAKRQLPPSDHHNNAQGGGRQPPRNKRGRQTQEERTGPPSLLQKLLSSDIQRERMLTIQLLNFIVDTNFLEPPKTAKEDAAPIRNNHGMSGMDHGTEEATGDDDDDDAYDSDTF